MKRLILLLLIIVVSTTLYQFSSTSTAPNPQDKQSTYNFAEGLGLCGVTKIKSVLKLIDTTKQIAPLLENLGSYTFKVSTSNELRKNILIRD
ncbi:MAG: hypothetical protein HC811_02335 [Flammeovirgaceae bacterium]|nr:hypothetical protein [Flammeovirgaceae bacterium]